MNLTSKQIISDLNSAQKDAVVHDNGPLLILAGAGTGKTMAITKRILYLLVERKVKPEEILALTFTERAAEEMKDRIDKYISNVSHDMSIGTFHEFCGNVLRERGYEIGVSPDFKILTELESWLFIHKNLFKFDLKHFRPLGSPTKFISLLQKFFSKLKDENISPDEFSKFVEDGGVTKDKTELEEDETTELNEKYTELAKAYELYEELMHKNSNLDFADLIFLTLKLFRSRPSVLGEYQRKFKHILVDEFQDTNFSQSEIVKLLSDKHKNITVVGDDDQAIYRFRGASIANILNFRKNYPEAKQIVLTDNYRSTQDILDSAHQLIQANNPNRLEAKEKLDKKLVSMVDNSKRHGAVSPSSMPNNTVELKKFDGVRKEVEWVVEKIKEMSESKTKFSNFAILARANNHLQMFASELEKAGIPFQTTSEEGLLQTTEVKDILAMARIMMNARDTISWFRFLHLPVFNIEEKDLLKIMVHAREYSQTMHNVIVSTVDKKLKLDISDKTKKELKKILDVINKSIEFSGKHSAGETLHQLISELRLYEYMKNNGKLQSVNRIVKFFNLVKDFEENAPDKKIPHLLEYLDLLAESGEEDKSTEKVDANAVTLSTVHSSKGLEWNTVFVVNMIEGRFPGINRKEPLPVPENLIKENLITGDVHMEEERRLFYVAMTRAQRNLFITHAELYGGGKRKRKPSRFLDELMIGA